MPLDHVRQLRPFDIQIEPAPSGTADGDVAHGESVSRHELRLSEPLVEDRPHGVERLGGGGNALGILMVRRIPYHAPEDVGDVGMNAGLLPVHPLVRLGAFAHVLGTKGSHAVLRAQISHDDV